MGVGQSSAPTLHVHKSPFFLLVIYCQNGKKKKEFRGFQSPEVREKKSKSQVIHICGFHCDDN